MKKEIIKYIKGTQDRIPDEVAVEEPMEMVICYKDNGVEMQKTIAITMRTPGDDFDLARGFLFTENIISSSEAIVSITHEKPGMSTDANKVFISIKDKSFLTLPSIDRNFYTTSSCGICGKSGIEAITTIGSFLLTNTQGIIKSEDILKLSATIFKEQNTFQRTGGIHATALYNYRDQRIILKEDVGRHNAMDKAIGALLAQIPPPFSDFIAFVSGRISFELVQKAYLTGISTIIAFGAPTSLAVEFAEETGMTLIGFLKKERFNIYTLPSRIMFE